MEKREKASLTFFWALRGYGPGLLGEVSFFLSFINFNTRAREAPGKILLQEFQQLLTHFTA
jgi:hypothetical protein